MKQEIVINITKSDAFGDRYVDLLSLLEIAISREEILFPKKRQDIVQAVKYLDHEYSHIMLSKLKYFPYCFELLMEITSCFLIVCVTLRYLRQPIYHLEYLGTENL